MSIKLNYDAETHCIHVRMEGCIDLAKIYEFGEKIAHAVKHHNCDRILNDARDTHIQISAMDLIYLPKTIFNNPSMSVIAKCKRALISSPGSSGFELFQTMSKLQGQMVKLFSHPDDGLKWLLSEEDSDHAV